MNRRLAQSLVVLVFLLGLAALIRMAIPTGPGDLVAMQQQPVGIMGTTCRLVAVGSQGQLSAMPTKPWETAESELRRLEALMSTWIEDSEVSQLNRVNPCEQSRFTVSKDTAYVIQQGLRFYEQTDGAFNCFAKDLFDHWKERAKYSSEPDDLDQNIVEDLIRENCDPKKHQIDGCVVNTLPMPRMDLSGLAKGYAIDKAMQAMQTPGITGGLVDVGGDIRCFGRQADGSPWLVKIKNPFGEGVLMTLSMDDGGAVCTSGNYARYVEIAGKRYSHIIDPRTGWPADAAPSVTVIAPDCITADAWATALSVLGPAGLNKIEAMPGVEAMIVTGDEKNHDLHYSSGFKKFVVK